MTIRRIATRDFDKEVLSRDSPLVVLFEAELCPFCAQFRGIFEPRVNAIPVPVLGVLLNDYDDPLWDRYSIEAVPTIAVFESGEVAFRIDGPLGIGLKDSDTNKLLAYIGKHIVAK